VASPKSKRRSRKRRNPETAPRAVVSSRRDARAERQAQAALELKRGGRTLGREGERPEGLFGGVPVSEAAILIGGIGLVVGFIQGGGVVLIVGIVVVALGVIEVTAREHFSGYRSHATLLAAAPAVAVESVIVGVFGVPQQRALLFVYVAPLFAVLFWWLRRRFARARQARVSRVARPPTP
jgi:phosphatidylserine synthase